MKDEDKTRKQLIEELAGLRQRLAAVKSAPVEHWQPEEPFQDGEGQFPFSH